MPSSLPDLDLSAPQGAPLACTCTRPTLALESHRGVQYSRCTSCGRVRTSTECKCNVLTAGLANYDRASKSHTCRVCGLTRVVARALQQPAAVVADPPAPAVDTAAIEREWVAGEAVRSATCGYLVGWSGDGSLPLAEVGRIAQLATPAFAVPSAKSLRALLGAAVAAHTSRLVRSVAEGRRGVYSLVQLAPSGAVGDSAGERSARLSLQADGSVYVEGSAPVVAAILGTYAQLQAEQALAAAEVTTWLEDCIVSVGGVRSGANWYLGPAAFARLQPVILALRALRWGSSWLCGLPVIRSEALVESVLDGLDRDLTSALASLEAQRSVASSRGSQVGQRAVSTAIAAVQAIATRGHHYAELFGASYASGLRERCRAAVASLSDLCDDAVQRFDLIYDEISRSDP